MARAGIYKSEVLRARDKLLATGRNPSIDAVREELGTGSKSTIHRYLKEIEEEEGPATGSRVAVSEALQDLVGRVAERQQMRQQERNRLEAGTYSSFVADSLQTVLDVLAAQIQALQQAIQTHVQAYPALQRTRQLLTSIPGIGSLTATRLMVELPDIQAFTTPKQLVAYAGLAPAVHQSGTSVHRRAHTSRKGNAVLRAQLFMPALVALRHNPVIQALQQRLQRAGKAKMVIVVAAMRKLLHLVYGILKSGRPFDPVLALSPGPGA